MSLRPLSKNELFLDAPPHREHRTLSEYSTSMEMIYKKDWSSSLLYADNEVLKLEKIKMRKKSK